MNTFRLGTLIRRTSSQISSNKLLRFSGSFASIPKSRFFSNGADGESALYHHARLFRKPLSTGFKSHLSSSVSLMGFVDRPIRVMDTEPNKFGVSTLLRVKDPRDQNRSFSIRLSMWDAMARKCIAHLKPNDFILVSGRLVSFGKSSRNESSSLGLHYQVRVTEVNYVMAPPSHILDSVAREDDIEESKNGNIHLWQAFFANPDKWMDKRRNKMSPRQPDFTHKDTNEALWLNSYTPDWVTRQLELFDQRRPDSIEESKNDEIHLWKAFFANPDEWWDKRRNKKNPRQPDFKHKDTGEALWLNSYTPVWVTRQFELFDQGRADGIEESNNAEIYLWQVFFANPHEWWDNRRNKKNPRQPDFKHKDTGESLWLESDTPVWVTRQLELLDQRNTNKSCYDQEQTFHGGLGDWV